MGNTEFMQSCLLPETETSDSGLPFACTHLHGIVVVNVFRVLYDFNICQERIRSLTTKGQNLPTGDAKTPNVARSCQAALEEGKYCKFDLVIRDFAKVPVRLFPRLAI